MKYLMLWILLFISFISGKSYCKIIEGSFLQFDNETIQWKKSEWDMELAYMKDIGMNELIIQGTVLEIRDTADPWHVFWDSAYYPSTLFPKMVVFDLIDTILSACDEQGIKVYLGLLWYNIFPYWLPQADSDYTYKCIAIAHELVDSGYTSHPSFQGWYIPYEFSNWIEDSLRIYHLNLMSPYWKMIADTCHFLSPKPVLISPYFEPENLNTFEMWCDTFATKCSEWGIDAVAFQDGIGVYRIQLNEIPTYFSRIDTAFQNTGVAFWSTLETFDTTIIPQDTIFIAEDIDTVIRQIEIESPYVEKIVCFEFNHYMSPVRTIKSWENLEHRLMAPKLYDDYKEHFWDIRNLAYNSTYELITPAYPDHLDEGNELIDTTISFDWRDYVGWLNVDSVIVKIDLGSVDTIRDIRAYFLQDTSSAIYLPTGVKVLISEDDINYSFIGSAEGFRLNKSIDAIVPFTGIDSVYTGQWVKLVIFPGGAWTFLSEVQVFGDGFIFPKFFQIELQKNF
ncbi:DUF4434 domain-containing protein [candidate division WOR-3 bacterium]|nr:DUF4434 domain-containing protein [candidate division WOR-3 bacterium]